MPMLETTNCIPVPQSAWIGYRPAYVEAGPQTLWVYAPDRGGVGLCMHLPVNSESGGIVGRQYNVEFTDPQALWDFLAQLPREVQTALHNQWGWRKPQPATRQRTSAPSRQPKIKISLDDLEL